jgi:hypothetical protein
MDENRFDEHGYAREASEQRATIAAAIEYTGLGVAPTETCMLGPERYPSVVFFWPDGRPLIHSSRPGGPVDSLFACWTVAEARAFLTAASREGAGVERLNPVTVTWDELVNFSRGALARGLTFVAIIRQEGSETEVKVLTLSQIVARGEAGNSGPLTELHEGRYPRLLVCNANGRPWVRRTTGYGRTLAALWEEHGDWFESLPHNDLRALPVSWADFLARCREGLAAGVQWLTITSPGEGDRISGVTLEPSRLLARFGVR